MSLPSGTHQIVRAVADGTGLSEEEVWMRAAVIALVTTLVGFFRAVEFVTDLSTDLIRSSR